MRRKPPHERVGSLLRIRDRRRRARCGGESRLDEVERLCPPRLGALSIVLVLAAFALLAEAIKDMDLAVAYALLGATGIFVRPSAAAFSSARG